MAFYRGSPLKQENNIPRIKGKLKSVTKKKFWPRLEVVFLRDFTTDSKYKYICVYIHTCKL